MIRERYTEMRFFFALALLTAMGAFLRIYALGDTPPTADDYGVITSAFDYMERGHFGVTMWQHPKLRNILVYCSLNLLGENMWGLKATSLSCGIFSIPLIGLIMKRLFGYTTAALLAALFIAVDPIHIDFSRQAIQEVHMPFFSLLAIYVTLRYMDGKNPFLLLLSGISFGLGISSKWYVLFPLFVTFATLAIQSLKTDNSSARKTIDLLFLISVFVLLPSTIYLLTYFPWFLHRGYGMYEWVTAQRFMYQEALTHQGFNPIAAQIDPNQKLWFVKPVAFADFIFAEGKPLVLLAISNPLVWMLSIPASGYLAYNGLKEKNWRCWFLFALFWISYLPLAAASRPIWVSTSLAVIPFAFMAVAYFIATVLLGRKNGGYILALYVITILVVAAPLYLLAIGKGFENSLLRPVVELYRPANER